MKRALGWLVGILTLAPEALIVVMCIPFAISVWLFSIIFCDNDGQK